MMSKKTIKRILYGFIAVVFLAFAGRELLSVGMNPVAAASGGAGLYLGFMALTGAG
jgi:hypothetical protein